jgi:hypothetical protein
VGVARPRPQRRTSGHDSARPAVRSGAPGGGPWPSGAAAGWGSARIPRGVLSNARISASSHRRLRALAVVNHPRVPRTDPVPFTIRLIKRSISDRLLRVSRCFVLMRLNNILHLANNILSH